VTDEPRAPDGAAQEIDLEVPHVLDGQRVDRSIAMLTGLARSAVAALVAEGRVTVDDAVVRTRSHELAAGQRLRVVVPTVVAQGPEPDDTVDFAVVAEDDEIVVVDKPAGLVVHHGAGHHGATLVDGLLAQYPEMAGLPAAGAGAPERPGIVHRLDKGTSGLIVVARTPAAFHSLSDQFRRHSAGRSYLALVVGLVEADQGVVDAPIGRSSREPTRMAVRTGGRPARTAYRVRSRHRSPSPSTLIEADLETGRTHQVRVHLAAIGHPIIGDERYGHLPTNRYFEEKHGLDRSFVHLVRIEIAHPRTGTRLLIESTLPGDLRSALERATGGSVLRFLEQKGFLASPV